MKRPKAVVVGCGVSGLTCGIRLLESQFDVTIFARELPPFTTSNVAAAVWYPYMAYPEHRVLQWGRISIDQFYQLMTIPEAGVSTIIFTELFDQPVPDPWWKAVVREFYRMAADELPCGYQDGYAAELPLIETPLYMKYLLTRFGQLGGQIEERAISKLSELYRDNPLIINCTGVGAKELVGDSELYPIRGQIIRAKKIPGMDRGFMDDQGHLSLAYVIPRSQDLILGGTAEENNWNLEADDQTATEILRKCKQLSPGIEDVEILEHLVGLRPGRREVRLEVEQPSEDCTVIHNYGHGGAGFTLSWGCADEVVELAQQSV